MTVWVYFNTNSSGNRRLARHVSLLGKVNSQKPAYTFLLTPSPDRRTAEGNKPSKRKPDKHVVSVHNRLAFRPTRKVSALFSLSFIACSFFIIVAAATQHRGLRTPEHHAVSSSSTAL
jgi:hypothetical protein